MHVQRMLKMSRVYRLAEILSKEILGPYLRSWLDKLTIWCQLNFYQNKLCDHCLHDLHLYIQKMLTYREMVKFQKWDFFRFFFILLLKIVSLKEHEKCLLSIRFALFVANNA